MGLEKQRVRAKKEPVAMLRPPRSPSSHQGAAPPPVSPATPTKHGTPRARRASQRALLPALSFTALGTAASPPARRFPRRTQALTISTQRRDLRKTDSCDRSRTDRLVLPIPEVWSAAAAIHRRFDQSALTPFR